MAKRMTDDELITLARREIEAADIQGTSEIRTQRATSYDVYVNQKVGKLQESTGLSGVWLNEHFDYSERLTTYITKAVTADPEVVVLETKNPQMQGAAKQTQCLLNYALMQYNNGYKILNNQIKDACINKNGITKVFWDTTPVMWEEEVEVQGDIEQFISYQIAMMGDDLTIEIIKAPEITGAETSETVEMEDGSMASYNSIQEMPSVYTLRYTAPKGLTWENVPREEFVTNTECVSLDDETTRFVGHRREVMVGDIVAMYPEVFKKIKRKGGYDSIADAAEAVAGEGEGNNDLTYDYERINRFYWDGTYNVTNEQESQDPMTRKVSLVEGYYKIDYYGNGQLVWVKLVWAGDVLFEQMMVECHPFASFTLFPIPHKFDGQSVYDVIESTMLGMTGLLRSKVDNSIQRNIVRMVGNRKGIDDRALQQGRPGMVHVKNMHQGAVQFLETPAGATDTVAILQYLDMKISAKIGISSVNDGTNVDLLKSGNDAAKIGAVQQQANQNVEMYVRELCETSIRSMVWKAFKILLEQKDSYFVVNALKKLYGVQQDPLTGMEMPTPLYAAEDGIRDWFDKADFVAKVGLGHMTKQEKFQAISAAMQVVAGLPAMGIPVPPNKSLKMAEDALKYLGLTNYLDYIPTNEEVAQFAQQAQQQEAMAQQEAQAMKQLAMQKEASEVRENNAKAAKLETETATIQPEFELKVMQTQAEIELNKEPKFQ